MKCVLFRFSTFGRISPFKKERGMKNANSGSYSMSLSLFSILTQYSTFLRILHGYGTVFAFAASVRQMCEMIISSTRFVENLQFSCFAVFFYALNI